MGEIHELDYNTPYVFTGIPQKGGKYGVTYRIISYRRNKPKTQQEVYTFLQSILTSNQADVLYKEYPDIIERVTENKPVDLSRLKGIGEATFIKIKDKIIENFMLLDLINEFKGCLSLSLLRQMYDKYTNIEIIRSKIIKDPYKFLCELSGVGFKTADEILLNLEKTGSIKFEYDLKTSLQRCTSCISYCLRENENNGSTRIELVELSKHVKNTTPECFQHFVEAIKNPMFYVGSDDHEETSVSLVQTYNVEKYIYNTIKNSTNIDNKWHFDIEKYRTVNDSKLTDSQMNALKNLCENQFSILVGYSGTGKSYSVQAITNMLREEGRTFTMMAPTGKASKVLSAYTGYNVTTIHMGLGFIPPDQWSFNETNKIKSDVIIVDESSMIDIFLFKRLISAIDFQRTKLLLIGDPAQLPSVSCGNLLHDLLALKFVKRTMLTEVFRYGEGGLMKVATDVRNCKQYIDKMDGRTKVFGDNKDYIFMNFDKQSGLEVLLQTYKTALQKYDVKDVSVLMAYRKGEFGTVNVNKMLQKIANKNARENNEEYVEAKGTKFYVGDIVMQTRNNREARLVREEQFGNNEIYYEQSDTMVMIANGESGVIEVIQDGLVVINFNGLRIAYEKKDMQDVDLGFSCTVHKCVTANTFIYTNKGLKRLGELNPGLNTIGKIKINDDTKVYNGKYLEKPSYFINAGRQPCINIVTKKNFTITGTYDHGIDVLTKDCNIVRKNLEEVTKDDFVVIAKNNNVKVEENLELPKEWSNIDLNVRAKVFKLPQKMTEEFAEFLGMMVADGVLAHSGIRYGKNQVESVLRFRDLGYELFGYKVDSNFKHLFEDGAMGGMYTYEIASMHILQYCKNMEFLNPNHKYIPELIINADEKYQACFLRGIFEDGTVNIKGDDKHFDHIELVMADKNMIETIRMMLLNMGIVSTMRKKKDYEHYTLYLYREYAQVYAEKIGFICRMKQDRLKKCFKPIISGEGLPYVDDVIRKIVANNRLVFKKKMPRLYNRLYKYRTPVYSAMLKEFVDNFKDKLANDEDFKKLQYISNYCFVDSVKEINKTEDEVYCLEMPETHRFVQNGFYGWNCQGSQNKIIILFTPSSHTYMLNSNLLYVGLTRMQEKVFHIGDLKTVNNAVLKKENLERNTWLRNFKSD